METIFEHNPTQVELASLTDAKTKQEYLSNWMCTKEHSLLDIVLLFEMRNDEISAKTYRDLIPDLYQEYILGFDNEVIS